MDITFACPECEQTSRIPLEWGTAVACPQCYEILIGTNRFRRRWTDVAFRLKDPWSMITHAAGVAFGVVVLVLLVSFAAFQATPWHVVGFTIYGVSVILLYGASTVYHWLDISRRGNRFLERLDSAWGPDLTSSEVMDRLEALMGPSATRSLAEEMSEAEIVKFGRLRPAAPVAEEHLLTLLGWLRTSGGPR